MVTNCAFKAEKEKSKTTSAGKILFFMVCGLYNKSKPLFRINEIPVRL